MINAQDIKIGTAIRMDGKLYFCIDFLHVVRISSSIKKVKTISS